MIDYHCTTVLWFRCSGCRFSGALSQADSQRSRYFIHLEIIMGIDGNLTWT